MWAWSSRLKILISFMRDMEESAVVRERILAAMMRPFHVALYTVPKLPDPIFLPRSSSRNAIQSYEKISSSAK